MTVDSFFYNPIPQHTYNFYFTDLRNNSVMAELPVKGVSYSNELSDIGTFSGKISINSETQKLFVRASTHPGKTGIYVTRDDEPVWGGMLWKRAYDSGSRQLSISGETFESYFDHRLNLTTKYFSNTDQLEIARWIVTSNQAAQSVLIDVSNAVSTRRRERTFLGYEFKMTGEELSQLAKLLDGFDYNVVIGRNSLGDFTRKLEFWYPQAGVSREKTQLLFEYPGSVREFSLTEDAKSSGNAVWAIGGGEGTETVRTQATDAQQLSQGWPKLELSRSYKSVFTPSVLQAHADSDRDQYRTPVTVFEVEVRPDAEPQLGTYHLGDWARFRLEDDFVTPALDQYARITGISVSVEDASGLEKVSLTLGGDDANTGNEV